MTITIALDLPEALLNDARAKGLLESASMAELLATELRRRKAASDLAAVLDQIRAQPGEPMTEGKIAEVKATRMERQAREAGH